MAKAKAGSGMHRQFWVTIDCPHCGLAAKARRTLPGQAWYIRTHFRDDGVLCPPAMPGEMRRLHTKPRDPDQLELFSA